MQGTENDDTVLKRWQVSARQMVASSRKGPHDAPIRENTCGCGALRTPTSFGPLIRLRGYQADAGMWHATVLYGTASSDVDGSADSKASGPSEADGLVDVVWNTTSSNSAAGGSAINAPPPQARRPLPLLHYRVLSSARDGPGSVEVSGVSHCFLGGAASAAQPLPLVAFGRMHFWRFDLTVPVLDSTAQWLEYWLEPDGAAGWHQEHGKGRTRTQRAAVATAAAQEGVVPDPMLEPGERDSDGGVSGSWSRRRRRVYIPSKSEGWRWAFYSCAGFSLDVPAAEQALRYCGPFPLWSDLLSRHQERPFSALVGGGDQLYNDDVWQVPALKAWLGISNLEERLRAPFTKEMAVQALSYYVRHYCTHFMSEPVREAYTCIPQVNTWDDHDIFDGWGSYPLDLQTCPVFIGLLDCARGSYLLFQQHTTARRAASDGMLVTPAGGFHNVVALGPRQALVLPDQRAERSRFQVLPLESYADVFAGLVRLPNTIRHLTMVATVPVVYPHIIGSHRLLLCFQSLYRSSFFQPLMAKTGASKLIMNSFGEPELLDDLRDHWVAPGHLGERRFLIEHLQMFAKSRNCRVSLISGDVHLCAAGLLQSSPRAPWRTVGKDWRYMQQVISSAIVNKPPPNGLVRVLQWSGKSGFINRRTRNKMLHTFKDMHSRTQMLNMRNWCDVDMDQQTGELLFTLRVEREPKLSSAQAMANGGRVSAGGSGYDLLQPNPPTKQQEQQQSFMAHSRRLLHLLRCCLDGQTGGERTPTQQQQEVEKVASPVAAAAAAGSDTVPFVPASGSGTQGSAIRSAAGRRQGGAEYGIRTYVLRVPLLEVPRPPVGSLDHAHMTGEDF